MDEVTKIVNEADIMFGLRPALEKFGFSQEKDLFLSFEYEGKKYRTGAIPPSAYERTSSLSSNNINSAVLDCINKAEIQFSLGKAVAKELDLPETGDFVIKITIISESTNRFVLSWPQYCIPCHPGASFNCFK